MIKTDRKAEKEGTPRRMFATLPVGEGNEIAVTHDDLTRQGARRMIAAALEAEVDEYLASFHRPGRRPWQAAGRAQWGTRARRVPGR